MTGRKSTRGLRGLLVNSPAVAISMLALVFALGSGAGYAASTATGSTKPVFHQLKLGRGWHGQIEYTVVNGIVYLSGSANGNDRKSFDMVILPRSIAPKDQLDIPITFGGEGDGLIQVIQTGEIEAFPPQGGDFTFVSLSGVSFPIGAS